MSNWKMNNPKSSYIVQCSNTHIHLSKEDIDFCTRTPFQYKKVQDLAIKGEWVSDLVATIINLDGTLVKDNVKILGSDTPRAYSQIETDYGEATYVFNNREIKVSDKLTDDAPQYLVRINHRDILIGAFIPTDHIHIDRSMEGAVKLVNGKSKVIYSDGSQQWMVTKFNDLNYDVLGNQRVLGVIHKNKASYYSFNPEVYPV
jgi:propanediol utilization protein